MQNELGRFIAMDEAHIKTIIDRLKQLNLVRTRTDPNDGRHHLVDLTPLGKVIIERSIPKASLATKKPCLLYQKKKLYFSHCYKKYRVWLNFNLHLKPFVKHGPHLQQLATPNKMQHV